MLEYQIPRWMAKFKGTTTTDKAGDLFSYEEYEIWPEVCSECNCNLAEAQHPGCNLCRPAANRASDNTDERGIDRTSDGDGKRSRAASSRSDDEAGRSSKPKLAVARSPVLDFCERPPEVRKNRWHQPESTHGKRVDRGVKTRGGLPTRTGKTTLPRRASAEDRIHARLGEVHAGAQPTVHHGPLVPLRTVAGGLQGWTTFHNALYKSPKGTTTMDANIVIDIGKQIIIIRPPPRWEFYPKVGERIIISRSHHALDSITSVPATDISRQTFRTFTMEWKLHWGHFEKFAAEQRPKDKRCPPGHYRVDLEIEAISTTRVAQALHTLTSVRGMEEHNVNIVTPLQALLVCDDFMADDILRINNANSDRRRQDRKSHASPKTLNTK